jgi:3-deoxy-D-manno-octulosonic acid kinase
MLRGHAGGRGAAYFLRYQGQEWVLRHYRRGGLVARLLQDQYIGWRLEKSRSWLEWRLLAGLYAKGLPVPKSVAACVNRGSGFYRADLITRRIPNTQPLAQHLKRGPLDADVWAAVGNCLQRFHDLGVYHADLNANNILLDDQSRVYLIDFDRGELRRPGKWKRNNIHRLGRSLRKLKGLSPVFYFETMDWLSLLQGYESGGI